MLMQPIVGEYFHNVILHFLLFLYAFMHCVRSCVAKKLSIPKSIHYSPKLLQ